MTGPAHHKAAVFPKRFTAALPGHNLLLRKHLLERMELAHNQKLILVCAAAGTGKTTLVQQYHQRSRLAGRAALWVSLHAGDNDLQCFVDLLGCALHSLNRTPPAETHFTFEQVMRLIGQAASPLSIVLDGLEVIHAPAVFSCLQCILDNLPAGATLLIGSRRQPDLDLGSLRARGQMLELDTVALRLSLEETTRFIRDTCQLALSDQVIDTLQQRTEGWISALYLACLSHRETSEDMARIASFSGTNPQLAQYLSEDVLCQLDEETLLFLLQTSIATSLCAPLCDALSGRDDSAAMLQRLVRDNLLLQPVDDQQQHFRYHGLFAEYLRQTLPRRFPGYADRLRQVAARWYIDAGKPACAIDYLLDGNAPREAVKLLAEHIEGFVESGRTRRLLRWLDRFEAELLDEHPRLYLVYGWALLFARRFKDARRLIDHLSEHGRSPQAKTLQCLWLGVTDQSEECCSVALTHLQQLPAHESFQIRLVVNALTLQLIACGRIEGARELLLRSPACGVRHCIESVLDLSQGRLGAALQRLQRFADHNDARNTARLTCNVITALLLYERGELSLAEGLLTPALSQARDASTPDTVIICHVLMARLALSRGDRDVGLQHLVQLEQIGRQAGSQRIQCSAWLEHARVATLDKRLDTAEQAMHTVQRLSDWDRPGILLHANDVDCPLIARLRLRIAQGDYSAGATALQMAIEIAGTHQHKRRQIKLLLLLAMARDGQRNTRLARQALEQALRLACVEGFLQSFIEEGERLVNLLERWLARRQTALDSETAFVIRVLEQLGRAPCNIDVPGANCSLALTTREVQVLQLLAVGHRNRAIAEKLFLSECTVKSHLRKINVKLGTSNRIQALAIARSQGWLD